MKITAWDIMKLSGTFDSEFDPSDFSEEEIRDFFPDLPDGASPDEIRERYFEFYDDIKDRCLPKHRWSD